MNSILASYKISLGTLNALTHDIAEVIADEGIEIDLDMVHEYHQCLKQHFTSPCSVLVNKKNTYTYTFDAQLTIGTSEQIKSLAIVTYNHATEITAKNLANFPRTKSWDTQFFTDRQSAIDWLIQRQSQAD
ncbi:hypothetical protein C2869_21190 [Saccharobesus litoralis]|uniref:SpoIIAA-like n=1 Tax=Saccharobesus litoralis TaxID=2172099 RepID=A0A2S0VX03_9ALTE|nr:hypothetical protein [Saccharobesus litoralis]AWB68756.1 hypothetical protein C2869_21190 [Saccharobesus litoralis]